MQSLLADFADDPVQLWESNIFGKSLHELVNDGLQNKLLHIPQEARTRLQETLERVINEGCTGLICILISGVSEKIPARRKFCLQRAGIVLSYFSSSVSLLIRS